MVVRSRGKDACGAHFETIRVKCDTRVTLHRHTATRRALPPCSSRRSGADHSDQELFTEPTDVQAQTGTKLKVEQMTKDSSGRRAPVLIGGLRVFHGHHWLLFHI